MTWQALWSADNQIRRMDSTQPAARLDWGTLLLEFDLWQFGQARAARHQPLLCVSPPHDPTRTFTIEPGPDGRLHLLRRQGRDVSHLSIGLGREPISGILRLTYHWDTRRSRSLLTAENLTKGTIRQQEDHHALPMLADEVTGIFVSANVMRHAALDWIGLADHWQTVGPLPGFAPGTDILTPDGLRRIETLAAGDLVTTADHGPLPLLWQGRVALPAMGQLRPVRLIAPYFGLKRDILVQPGQRFALSGPDVEYHFNEEAVLVEARQLVNDQTAIWGPNATVLPSHGLLFDRHALVQANGIWSESLYLGRIGRNPDLARTTAPGALGQILKLPEHGALVRRELLDYEAQILNLSRLRSRAPLAA